MKWIAIILFFLFNGCVKSQQTYLLGVREYLINIPARGNSLTFGSFATSTDSSYPSRLQAYFGNSAIVRQQGIPGDQTYATMLTTFNDSIAAHYLTRYTNICLAWEIRNELAATLLGGSTSSVGIDSGYNRMERFCLQAKAVGFKVIVGTCIASNAGGIQAQFDSCRLVINQRIRDNFPGEGITVCDLASVSQLNTITNPVYFQPDQVHLTDAGYMVVFQTFLTSILSIL